MVGFDNEKYLRVQSEQIRSRINQFGGKLYLEFGGKLFDDYHASRVLPGFEPDSKMKMLKSLGDDVEIVMVISATDIEKNKKRGDLGIAYKDDVLRLIDEFRNEGMYVGGVAITHYDHQKAAKLYMKHLEGLGIKCYRLFLIPNYPSDVDTIVSDEGFGKNEYIETTRKLVVVTAPGPGSGKMAVCLSQLYHEYKRGIQAGYAKFETFPVWNLPLKHPINLAYEAATADLDDINQIDPFYLQSRGETAINYNRDIEIFPVLQRLFEKIQGTCPYDSPTAMGVNMLGFCIEDMDVCCVAAKKEILRRLLRARVDQVKDKDKDLSSIIEKLTNLTSFASIDESIIPPIYSAKLRAEQSKGPAGAILLPDGKILTGKTSDNLGAAAALMLNTIKYLAGIERETLLIDSSVLEPVCHLKKDYLGHRNPRLHTDETLLALSISALHDPDAETALKQLPKLKGSEAHFTVIISEEDEQLYKHLGIQVTYDPVYEQDRLYH